MTNDGIDDYIFVQGLLLFHCYRTRHGRNRMVV